MSFGGREGEWMGGERCSLLLLLSSCLGRKVLEDLGLAQQELQPPSALVSLQKRGKNAQFGILKLTNEPTECQVDFSGASERLATQDGSVDWQSVVLRAGQMVGIHRLLQLHPPALSAASRGSPSSASLADEGAPSRALQCPSAAGQKPPPAKAEAAGF